MGGMNLLDPMGIISGSASAVGSFIPLPNLGALGAVLPGFRGFGAGLPAPSMAARAARGQQCGGAGLACVAFSYFCVDAPFPNVACGQGACTRLSEWCAGDWGGGERLEGAGRLSASVSVCLSVVGKVLRCLRCLRAVAVLLLTSLAPPLFPATTTPTPLCNHRNWVCA